MIYHTTYRSPFFDLQYGFFTAPPKTWRPRHCLMRGKSRIVPSPAASLNGTIGLAPAIPHLARCTPARRSSRTTTTAQHFRPQASGSWKNLAPPLIEGCGRHVIIHAPADLENRLATSSATSKQGRAPPTSEEPGETQVAPTHAALLVMPFRLGLGLEATLGCSGIHFPCPLSQLCLPQHMYQDSKTGT